MVLDYAKQKAAELEARISAVAGPMNLSTAQTGTLISKVTTNSEVDKLITRMDSGKPGSPPDPRYNKFLEAMGQRFKADTGIPLATNGFVDKLNKDLKANPALGDRLVKAIQANPDLAAKAVLDYKHGDLAASVSKLEADVAAAKPAPAAAAVKDPPPQQRQDAQRASAAPPPAQRTQQAPADRTAPPAERRPDPITVAAAPPAAAPPTASPPAGHKVDVAAAMREAREQTIRGLVNADDATIKEQMTPALAKEMAKSIAEYGAKKFPDLKQSAQGFADKVESSPELQKKIAENLANNPNLVRQLTKAMTEEGASSPGMDSQIRGVLKEVYEKPDKTIADNKWTDGLQSKMMMGGAMDWVKTNLGFDLQGMMNGIGQMFQGLFKMIGNFFNQFGSGNFMQIGNMDPNAGFFTKLGRSWDQAQAFDARKPALLEQAQTMKKPGAEGAVSDGIKRDAEGNPVMVKETKKDANGQDVTTEKPDYSAARDHRITINPIGNNSMKIYPTDNLNPSREPNGNYRWTVITEIDPKSGAPKDIQQVVVSEAESKRMFKMMEDSAKANGTQLRMENPHVNPEPTQELQHGRSVQAYVAVNGRAVEMNVQQPGGPGTQGPGPQQRAPSNTPELEPKPGITTTG